MLGFLVYRPTHLFIENPLWGETAAPLFYPAFFDWRVLGKFLASFWRVLGEFLASSCRVFVKFLFPSSFWQCSGGLVAQARPRTHGYLFGVIFGGFRLPNLVQKAPQRRPKAFQNRSNDGALRGKLFGSRKSEVHPKVWWLFGSFFEVKKGAKMLTKWIQKSIGFLIRFWKHFGSQNGAKMDANIDQTIN